MSPLLRAEFRKLRWTRSLWALPLAGVVISVVAGTVLVVAFKRPDIASHLSEHGPLRFGISNVGLVITLLGIRLIGDEFQHRTLAPTLLRAPNRTRLLLAKVVVAVAAAAAVTAVVYTLVIPSALVVLGARDLLMTVDAAATAALFGRVVLAMALLAALGVGLAGAIRNRTVALIAFVLGTTLGESIVGGLLRIPEYMPSPLVDVAVSGRAADGVTPVAAFALLAALAGAAIGAAVVSMRGDVG